MKTTVKVMAWNANGIMKKKEELELILENREIDICLISETHLTKQMFINFRNYFMYCSNHPLNNARGGSAILVKKSLEHYEEEKISTAEFQAATINIKLNDTSLSITSIYSPPRHNIKCDQYKIFLNKHKGRFVIGGDFNAKHVSWGSRLTTSKGRELLNASQQLGCDIISTGNPTYWPTDPSKTPDLIDFFVTKHIPRNLMFIEDGVELNSDHSPIFLTIGGELKKITHNISLSNKLTDWDYFKNIIDEKIDVKSIIKSSEDIDNELEDFSTQIQNATWMSTPVIQEKYCRQSYPAEILKILHEKRKIRKKWQILRFPEYKTKLNFLTKLLTNKIIEFKNTKFNDKIKRLSADKTTDYSLWKMTAHMKRPICHNPPIRLCNGIWAKNDFEKAEAFALHLEKIFQPIEGTNTFNDLSTVQDSTCIQPITTGELLNEIKKLKLKKSPGFDLITSEVLKNLSPKALRKLLRIMNACLKLKYFPSQWKVSEIIMIPKPGKDTHELSSYRPISLLPIMGKLFEKLFLTRLKHIILLKELIPSHQFGFREKHSTIDQVHRIAYVIEEALEKKKVCAAIFLDVAQAFDKVWHEGLIYKLKTLLPPQFTKMMESYINNRYYRVKIGQEYSSMKKICAGVPQGSVLGPTLYLLYTADIPIPANCTLATFADDTCILATGEDETESTAKLQLSVNAIVEWTNKWRIKLNESKSTHINFTNKNVNYTPLEISGKLVPYANTAKYLGMTLDTKLKWKEHIKIKAKELNIKYQKIKWLIGKHSKLSTSNKLLIYNQMLKPVWTYGIQLWGCAIKNHIDVVQRIQNKILRNIVNAPWYVRNIDLHRDLKISTVSDAITIMAAKHATRLLNHLNSEASILNDEELYTRRLKRKKPQDLVVNNI